jgi:hypothetical protein
MTEYEIRFRTLREDEVGFVYATFLNAYVKNAVSNLRHEAERWKALPSVYRSLPVPALCTHYHDEMEHALREGKCIVAVDPEDSVLLGYVVYRDKPASLTWIYVKNEFKEFGIEYELIKACGFDRSRHVFLPYKVHGLSKLLREMGLREI